ncbi:MAG TPA: alpha/beta hydrolase [Pirellulales bacterium]|nr:alpha/beta hydrolase [Pirellulales bacterium]
MTEPRPQDASQARHSRTGVWRRARRLALLAAAGYVLVLVWMMFLEESLVFFPSREAYEGWKRPGVEEVEFRAADGTRLYGWYMPHPSPRALLLFACGNAGNITHRAERFEALRDRHELTVFAFDYRGYGRSDGRPNEAGILLDARAARRWLADRAGVAEGDIVLMGESLGGGVMVDLAARDGARGLVLENTFTSLPAVAAYHYPWLPVRLVMRNRLDSLSKIGSYHGPLLQCHGDADQIIPFAIGQELFEAANQSKRFVHLPGHDHNDELPSVYSETLEEFVAGLP